MKVRMDQDYESGQWIEDDHEEEIELPDAIVLEWRECRKRMEQLNAYFDERVPALVKEAEAKKPKPEGYGTITIGTISDMQICGPEDKIIYGWPVQFKDK